MTEKRVDGLVMAVVLGVLVVGVGGSAWLSNLQETERSPEPVAEGAGNEASIAANEAAEAAARAGMAAEEEAATASASIDPEEESIREAPRGAPRSVALRLTGGEWRRLRNYAVILGAASACGIDTRDEVQAVGRWMDRKFPPGTEGQGRFLMYFARIAENSARRMASGEAAWDCSHVANDIRRTRWP